MRTVEVSRRVDALPAAVREALDPASVVEFEGSFVVLDVEEAGDGWTVTARGSGAVVTFAFEPRDDGFAYRAVGDVGPFETLETHLALRPAGTGTEVTMRSSVSLRLPLPLVDRLAAHKRRAECERALEALASAVE